MSAIQPVILAGGTGSRLWPLSREMYPKQLLELTDDTSLLQTTLLRVAGLQGVKPPLVIVGEEHRYITKKQVDELDLDSGCTILLEPLGKNTAPAVCGAAQYVEGRDLENTILLVLPADHLIRRFEAFQEAVLEASELAAAGGIVTFGIPPLYPETGYGYIEKGPGTKVLSFKEKPELDVAKEYLQRGNYLWNSGMLAFSLATFREEMERYAPDMYSCMAKATARGTSHKDFFQFHTETMLQCSGGSIDYALMEKTGRAEVVSADLGWTDIGSWQALWQVHEKDELGNLCLGDVLVEDTRNCLVYSEDTLVATVGMEDTVIVETSDAVLVVPRTRSQEVKKVVKRLIAEDSKEFRLHRKAVHSWGVSVVLGHSPQYRMKRVTVNQGEKLAMSKHHYCHEHWVVVEGTARVTKGETVFLLFENQSTYIPAGTMHRLENPGSIPLELVAVQVGNRDEEGDGDCFSGVSAWDGSD